MVGKTYTILATDNRAEAFAMLSFCNRQWAERIGLHRGMFRLKPLVHRENEQWQLCWTRSDASPQLSVDTAESIRHDLRVFQAGYRAAPMRLEVRKLDARD